MYVAPRPHVDDDPLFAVRLSSAAVLGFVLAILLQSPMPMLPPALIVGLMAGMRKAFDPKKAVGGPVAMIAMVTVISGLVELARPMPLVLITLVGALCILSYYIILSTGNPIGMLIAIAASHPRFPLSPNTFISCWNIYQMTAGGFLRDANTLPPGLRWIGYLSIQYYSHGVLSAAASADGVAEPRYSSLGIGGNITVVALIVVVLKMLLYVALRTRRLRFE